MTGTQRHCQECGKAYTALKSHGKHCSLECRKAFNNRRMRRGAELYDLYMASRYEREANPGGIGRMAQLGLIWRDEDKTQRGGRNSWTTIPPDGDSYTLRKG